MHVIAVLSQKGGAGKTTLAVHLAVAAEQAGQAAAIIDLDPQASVTGWADSRSSDAPAVVSAQASRLRQVLDVAERGGAALAIIDTAPHSESAALAAAREADLILIPCRPAILDLRAIGQTVDLARLAGKPAAIVLNAVPPRGTLTDEAVQAVEAYGLPVAPIYLGHRACARALSHGRSGGSGIRAGGEGGKGSRTAISVDATTIGETT
ncbi:MAG: ParA family protein [Myxococcales bacterium]